jgi:formate dehydrogenase iron-sulfur subunit
MPKAFLIDTSRCTACRGCQVACKEWHDLPAVATRQRGTHQNPPDLNPFNYKLVRFKEEKIDGRVQWLFFPDQCRHCIDPPCKEAADAYVQEAIVVDKKTRAVLYTEKTGTLTIDQCEEVRNACPYNIPRRNAQTGRMTKCDMCIDRLQANLLPACVKTCCTGTMNFGERAEMIALARERLASVKKSYPQAQLLDPDNVGTIFLVTCPNNALPGRPKRQAEHFSRRDLLANLVSPLRRIAD